MVTAELNISVCKSRFTTYKLKFEVNINLWPSLYRVCFSSRVACVELLYIGYVFCEDVDILYVVYVYIGGGGVKYL
jgi:hypothetical protein